MKDYLKLHVDIHDANLVSVIDELPLWSAPFGFRLLDAVELRKDITALDVGCGLGFPLVELSQRLGHSSRIYGIDPWAEALERVRLKLRVYDIRNVELVHGFAEDMPFENEFFDLIVSNNGMNNVRDLVQTLRECHRVSRANAQLVFTLNTEGTMKEFYSTFQEVLRERSLENEIRKMREHIYAKRRPVEDIRTLTEESGFLIRDIRHDAFELRFIDGTSMLNHHLIKYWFLDSWKGVLAEHDLAGVFDAVEARLNEQSDASGGVVLTIPFVTFDCRKKRQTATPS